MLFCELEHSVKTYKVIVKTHREAIDKVIENALTITAIDLFAFPMSVKSELL